MSTLGTLLRDLVPGPDGIAAHIPEGWMQGRTAFGGITAALALAAARLALPDLPRLRTMQVAYLRPIGADVTLHVGLVRAGRTSSFVRVEACAQDAIGATFLFVFGAARPSRHRHDHAPAPALPAPGDCPAFLPGGAGPNFLGRFNLKLAEGPHLVTGSDTPAFTTWSRLADDSDVPPEIALVCIADSLPPAAMTGFRTLAPISTITWTLDLARIPDRNDWISIRTASLQADEGYSVQDMALHDAGGRLIGSAQQLVALFD